MAGNPRYSMPPGHGAANGFHTNGAAVMPHLDDLVALPKDVDRNQPIKKLFEIAESSLRQAEFSKDIKRLAPALQDFVRAYIITVQYIGHHRDYELVKSRPDLSARHKALLKKLDQHNDAFAIIKRQIQEDNKRTGVLPSSSRPSSSQSNGPRPSSSSSERGATPTNSSHTRNGSLFNGSSIKAKPTIQPKPQSLHGNAIGTGHARTNSTTSPATGNSMQDLAARFANLRGPQASPGQDPRIKTHPINLPMKPAGPRAMPSPTKPQLALDSSVPSLPKLPDAIYSPARGSVSGEASRLPSSTNRGHFSRTSSVVSANNSPSLSRQQSHSNEYFPPQPPLNVNSLSRTSSRDTSLDLPRGGSITPEGLVQVMKGRVSILLIDVRSREEFNEGHIMHSTVICIEPSILERDDVSADEISQSMVLSPNQEQAHFERRNTFDMVVFYDESSSDVPVRANTPEGMIIMSLHRALVQFNYGKELRSPPKILKGGLEAWVDLMGPGSLQSTIDSSSKPSPGHRRDVTIERRRSRYVVKQLKPDDIKQWEATIQRDDQDTAASPNFVRSREDFLRRFPSVSLEQQSMTAPVAPRPRYGSSHKNDLESELPSPPSRPAPALPRQSYSSLAHNADEQDAYDGTIAQKLSGPAGKSATQVVAAPAAVPQFYTGLVNPHNWCYANGLLQSLLASPGFGREIANSEWVGRHRVPRKAEEKMDHPQLIMKIVSNLFHWMSSGKFQVMKAETLMNYVRHLCKQSSSAIQFGGSNQQDAQEFMGFLLDVIHDETNVHRDLKGKETQPPEPSKTGLSVLQTAARFWQSHLQYNQSIIDRYWRLLEVTEVRCRECATRTFTFSSWFNLMLPVTEATTLEAAIRKKCKPELIQGFHCNNCRKATNSDRSEYYSRLPDLVCVVLNRFNAVASSSKCVDRVSWDFNNLDLSPYFLHPSDCTPTIPPGTLSQSDERSFTGPFHYECYAVLIHVGGSVNSGHYYAYVRDQGTHDPYAWYCCNDERVTKVRIGCGGSEDARERVFKTGADAVPYMAFFKRKHGR